MTTRFTITSENNPQKFFDVSFKDAAITYRLDFNPWAEDNHDVITATWTVKAGSATISGETLVSNVATALITFSDAGRSLIQVKAATSAETYVAYLDVLAKDPQLPIGDYGLIVP